MWATRSLFLFWGHIPQTPCQGASPLDPRLPTPVGLGFASVLGPTRGGVANVGDSFPLLMFLGAHPPCPLGGGCAPSTPGLIKVGEGRPLSKRLTLVGVDGHTPHNPPPWGYGPLDPPLLTLVGLWFAGVLPSPRRRRENPAGLGRSCQPLVLIADCFCSVWSL
jgi:hypothetical protein